MLPEICPKIARIFARILGFQKILGGTVPPLPPRPIRRGDDFPFQKSAFSVWENSEFRFKGLPKWKFRLAIDNVHLKKHEFHFA